MNRWWRQTLLTAAAVALGLSSFAAALPALPAAAAAFADSKGHWAEATIDWGVEEGIVNGFPDGGFRPDEKVTEAQFAAMLFRAYPDQTPVTKPPYWYSAYYEQGKTWMWPLSEDNADEPAIRGWVAQTIAAALGRQLEVKDAVQWLLDRGLAQGRRASNGSVQFGERETLTRAEAVQFVRNVTGSVAAIGAADQPPAKERADAAASVSGIAVGDAESKLLAAFGEPARKEASEYGFTWYVYNADYERFAMFGVKAGTVTALYANGEGLSLRSSELGKPLPYIEKGNIRYLIHSDGEYDVFEAGNTYVTVFYDVHESRTISGVQAISTTTELGLSGFYGLPSKELADSFARLSLDLANSARVKRGLSAMTWDDGAAAVALGHSEQMAEEGFFDHVSPNGHNLGDRLDFGRVDYRAAGENIAYGQTSAIFAHEGWMNSSGHRKNMLGDFNRLGVGVAFTSDKAPYYTQNFLKR